MQRPFVLLCAWFLAAWGEDMDFSSDIAEAGHATSCLDHEDGAFLQATSQATSRAITRLTPDQNASSNDLASSRVSYLTGTCPALDAVGDVSLFLGSDVNNSNDNQVWKKIMGQRQHVLAKSADDAFEVRYVLNGRFSYPTANGFGEWQVRLSPPSSDLSESGWYLPPTAEEQLACSETVAEEVIFFRGFFFKSFQYGHVLHDLLPMLIWMSNSHPEARVFLELDTDSMIQSFIQWFDPELHKRTTFVRSGYVVCAASLWVVVPRKAPTPHELRIPVLFNHLRRHIAKVQPAYEATSVVYVQRSPSTAFHGRLLTEEHSQEVVQTAQSALRRHGMPADITTFDGTSDGKTAASFRQQYQLFNSAILAFGPHGTAFSNILWMPCDVPAAAVEFICGARSVGVRGCTQGNGTVRLATYFHLEGSISWVKYFHVTVQTVSDEVSDFMIVDLAGFDQALDAALEHVKRKK